MVLWSWIGKIGKIHDLKHDRKILKSSLKPPTLTDQVRLLAIKRTAVRVAITMAAKAVESHKIGTELLTGRLYYKLTRPGAR